MCGRPAIRILTAGCRHQGCSRVIAGRLCDCAAAAHAWYRRKRSRDLASPHYCSDEPARGPSACSPPGRGRLSKHITLLSRCCPASQNTNAAQGRRPRWPATCGSVGRCDRPTPISRRSLLVHSVSSADRRKLLCNLRKQRSRWPAIAGLALCPCGAGAPRPLRFDQAGSLVLDGGVAS